ncbi:unnamed protein product [Didymodactylos carnosus]|uniref:Uncharacterized protein n=1 Tax=Didymodactylos carnosus TaxID=1234261 RepID=A0A816ER22_9BILA|nr:unnamed protein product [Didymodactylos carnosus]CAF1649872.1 unnamed protein product [Didymodactylos carnosus]CAF4278932.1 unnamed protein product [Didymodactylos carnosus]CAF4576023.1 unnamed protein product [Didymodactylos carnosus]
MEKRILTTKFKKPRTTKEQKRRNRKGSLSYRKKNYAICVITQVDPRFTALEWKEILLGMGIQPRKTKIQGRILHFAMYNNEQQQQVDNMLDPNRIFTTQHYGQLHFQQQRPHPNYLTITSSSTYQTMTRYSNRDQINKRRH